MSVYFLRFVPVGRPNRLDRTAKMSQCDEAHSYTLNVIVKVQIMKPIFLHNWYAWSTLQFREDEYFKMSKMFLLKEN